MPDTSTGSASLDSLFDHPVFEGIDSEIAAIEGMYSEGSGVNIPWLLSLSVGHGNAMTSAIAMNAVVFSEPEWGQEGGGGGNESGASQFGSGGATGGLSVSW